VTSYFFLFRSSKKKISTILIIPRYLSMNYCMEVRNPHQKRKEIVKRISMKLFVELPILMKMSSTKNYPK
jgi:hypothetical protein